jgi:hypothetical protein
MNKLLLFVCCLLWLNHIDMTQLYLSNFKKRMRINDQTKKKKVIKKKLYKDTFSMLTSFIAHFWLLYSRREI